MTTLSFSDAYDLVSKKMLINKIAIDNIAAQIQYCKADQSRHEIIIDICTQKSRLLVELNNILEQQLKSFDEFRQNQCLEIYKEINALDEPSSEYIQLSKVCEAADNKLSTGMMQASAIESTIPDTMCVTNYKVSVPSII
jgi:DNA-directed RNA polymerase beta subunit